MQRQPIQVHVYLFRKTNNGYEYAIFQRSDLTVCWQGICGGLEDKETIIEGARREIREESGITKAFPLYKLDTTSYLPDVIISKSEREHWNDDVIVIPMYYFAMEYDGEIVLSDEHLQFKWMCYQDASDLIYFDDQKTALYELNELLLRDMIDKTRID